MAVIGLAPQSQGMSLGAAGELVVQNGRSAGARRPLCVPLTTLGRAAGCDLRLNVDGIDPWHCLITVTAHGFLLRDLDSKNGTILNGVKVGSALLHEGDLLKIGPVQFRFHLLPIKPDTTKPHEQEAAQRSGLRLQAAAVAAMQSAVTEEEIRLVQRQSALERQEEQLAAHLEEKRLKLLALTDRTEAERKALDQERADFEQRVEQVTGDLSQAQRELMDSQSQVQVERKRLADLHKRMRRRWHRYWLAERGKMQKAEEKLAEEARELEAWGADLQTQEKTLVDKRLRFNGLYELGRHHLKEAWDRLRRDQKRWKHRRGRGRAALKVREHDLVDAERKLALAQKLFIKEARVWEARKPLLQQELKDLNERVGNQRRLLIAQREEMDGLRSDAAPIPTDAVAEPPSRGQLVAISNRTDDAAIDNGERLDLHRLAGELADQRIHLVEQWQRLARIQERWQVEQDRGARELEVLARRLMDKGKELAQREQLLNQTEQRLKRRHEDLLALRHQMIAWRARLKVRENSWESDRNQLVAEVRHRETLADQNMRLLVDLRQRWVKRRTEEVRYLRKERQTLESLRKDLTRLKLLLFERQTAQEEEKRVLAEKALALEQYRRQFVTRNDEGAEKRIERLRRRLLAQHESLVRATQRERDTVAAEAQGLEPVRADLAARAESLTQQHLDLTEKQSTWEHQQTLALMRQGRLQEDLRHAQAEKALRDTQLEHMKAEIERIARALIEQPDPPALTLDQAA